MRSIMEKRIVRLKYYPFYKYMRVYYTEENFFTVYNFCRYYKGSNVPNILANAKGIGVRKCYA